MQGRTRVPQQVLARWNPRGRLGAASAALLLVLVYGFGVMPFFGTVKHSLSDRGFFRFGEHTEIASSPEGIGDATVARFNFAMFTRRLLLEDARHLSQLSKDPTTHESPIVLPEAPCPAELRLDMRPDVPAARSGGNPCEPWAGRQTLMLLHQLLAPNMVGLEWGAGSSTLWYLGRLGQLITIEHQESRAESVREAAYQSFDKEKLDARWQLKVLPPSQGDVLTFAQAETYEHFKKYADAAFLESKGGRPRFDFIAINGQARLACFQRALWMLRPHGGVLVLFNAQRQGYQEVHQMIPPGWLRFEDRTPLGRTQIWVSCHSRQC